MRQRRGQRLDIRCASCVRRARRWTFEALLDVRASLPVPLLGIDSDNGGEFINAHLLSWCSEQRLTFTRSRAYEKNDSCYVEQKNWSVVRRETGYGRYDTEVERELIAAIYADLRLLRELLPALGEAARQAAHWRQGLQALR